MNPEEIPVFILCGGLGTRIKEETSFRPKPMVPIGGKPILLHIMESYRNFGFKKFILCLGFKGEVIRDFFSTPYEDFSISLAETGATTMTGGRIARAARRFLTTESHFIVTYGDGLTDCNFLEEWMFHMEHGKIGTILGVNPPSRFGELKIEGNQVVQFDEKPEFLDKWINGGFFFFRREFLSYLSENEDCILEKKPLSRLAQDGELMIFRHRGFWACMDTQRDRDILEELWAEGRAPWHEVLSHTV